MKALIVTGASTGIGAATAELAASRGWAVCVNYRRSADEASRVVERIRAANGTAIACRADISNEDEIIGMFEEVDGSLGTLEGLVNNAGTVGGQFLAHEVPAREVRSVVQTKVDGTILCCREALQRMYPNGRGAIVNVSSASSLHGASNYWVHYAAANGAVDVFTRGLAQEAAPKGVRVNVVRPGFTDTAFHRNAGFPDRVSELKRANPNAPVGKPEDIALAIVWLLSDEARHVCGAILDVNGGRWGGNAPR